jgi:hypothetical protein
MVCFAADESSIEVISYVHGAAEVLGIQIDAAVSFYGCLAAEAIC